MALPVIEKTYQFDTNNAFATDGSASYLGHSKAKLRSIKNKLLGLSHSPWTVYYSCNSSVAGVAGDGVDRWATDANLVWSTAETNAHSWIVLRQAGLNGGLQLLLSLVCNADGNGLTAVTSVAGFTGGSTTARPTAADEVVHALGTDTTVGNATYKGWSSPLAASYVDTFNIIQSTDGQVTRVLFATSNNGLAGWLIEAPKNPVTGWNNPYFGCVKSSGSVFSVFGNINSVAADANTYIRARGSGVMSLMFASQGVRNGILGVTSTWYNDFTGEVNLNPWSLYSATASNLGRHGLVYDCWSRLPITGAAFPSTGVMRQIMEIGGLAVPWDGGPFQGN